MTHPALTLRPRYARSSLEFDERRARYAFLTPLLEAALAVELIDPKKAQVPGNAFLESLGASTTFSICCTPEDPPTVEALDKIESKSIGEPPIILIDDGSAWLGAPESLDKLIHDIDERLPRAKFAFTFRNPSGVSLASFGEGVFGGETRPFDFAECEQELQKRFGAVQFATQSALWGSQIAPLVGENLPSAIDGNLGDQPRAAFFIALCSQKPVSLPEEITLLPLPLAPLSAAAERFDKISDSLRKSESQRLQLEELLRQKKAASHDVEEAQAQAKGAQTQRDEAQARAQEALDRLQKAESLLDEVAQERGLLVAKLAQTEKALEEAQNALLEKSRQLEEALLQRDQTKREDAPQLDAFQSSMSVSHKHQDELYSSPSKASGGRLAQALRRATPALPLDSWRKKASLPSECLSSPSNSDICSPTATPPLATPAPSSDDEALQKPEEALTTSNIGEESDS